MNTKTERAKQLRTERALQNLCVMCGKTPPATGVLKCVTCHERTKRYPVRRSRKGLLTRRAAHKVYNKAVTVKRTEAGLCIACGKVPPNTDTQRCKACTASMAKVNARNRKGVKEEVFKAYGGYRCACCNEQKDSCFMQLDHKNGDGCKHLQPTGKRYKGDSLYRWLIRNGFPSGFQVLCADCNFAKGQNQECPHKAQERDLLRKVASLALTY